MMQNSAIAALLEEYADLLELQGANSFRVRAYRNASRSLEAVPGPIADIVSQAPESLTAIPGIGKDLAEKIVVIVEQGSFPALDELRAQFPPDVLLMLKIPGLGPKKVAALIDQLQITSLADLQAAAEAHRISTLKGFGAKTEQSILEGLTLLTTVGRRTLLALAKRSADEIVADLVDSKVVQQAEVAGSCRRRLETCGDLDVLAIAEDSAAAMDQLEKHPLVTKVLARGETKQRVRLNNHLELDLRVVPEQSYGAALQYFTGSKEHNIVIRRRAQERGLKLNEYGLFRGEEYVAGRTEQEVYAAVGLPWIPPELRENRGEIELAEAHRLPTLIELADMQGDLHMHTTATDGTATIEEMAEAAKARGLKYIAITDQSKRVVVANGLDAERLRQHWRAIDQARGRVSGIEILCGIECDILEDATLDLADDVLAEADIVLAVLHFGLKQPREQIMRRLTTAMQNPHVDVIGHPSGRLIGSRPGADIHYEDFLKVAAETGVLLEINANPQRLDLDDVHAAAAKARGIPIVINTDAHSTSGLDVMEYGIYQARRAGLTRQDVANAQSLAQLRRHFRS